MSTINTSTATDTRLDRTGLEPLGGQGAIDALHLRDQGQGAQQIGLEALRGTESSTGDSVTADAGEDMLNADAWTGVAPGDRLLAGDFGFEAHLGGMALSQAADHAADAVAAALI